jgi:hypothetical protein
MTRETIFEDRDVDGKATGLFVGRHKGHMVTGGAGHELCCSMAREIERLRAELDRVTKIARARMTQIEDMVAANSGSKGTPHD